LRSETIETRKAALVKLLRKADYGIFLNEHVEEEAATVFQHVQTRTRRYRVKASRIAVCVRALMHAVLA
jgi:hypothetical protein